MPTTVSLDQKAAGPLSLNDALRRDIVIYLSWNVALDPQDSILSQDCTLTLGGDHQLNVSVAPGARKFAFHLSAGTLLGANVEARVRVTVRPPQGAPLDVLSQPLEIRFPSAEVPVLGAMTAVYSDLNQELRRMRTFYESFLVVVTGGFATLVSKADAIAGARNRGWLGLGVALLTVIIIWLMWQVATRYNEHMMRAENIETALGFRARAVPASIIQDKEDRFREGQKGHTIWVLALIVYTLILGILTGGDTGPGDPDSADDSTDSTPSTFTGEEIRGHYPVKALVRSSGVIRRRHFLTACVERT